MKVNKDKDVWSLALCPGFLGIFRTADWII